MEYNKIYVSLLILTYNRNWKCQPSKLLPVLVLNNTEHEIHLYPVMYSLISIVKNTLVPTLALLVSENTNRTYSSTASNVTKDALSTERCTSSKLQQTKYSRLLYSANNRVREVDTRG